MPEIVGHVDERNRPLVRFSVPGQDDTFLALIDTGFNGHLFVQEDVAERLGFIDFGVATDAEFADQGRHKVYLAHGRSAWFGELVNVEVLIAADRPLRAASADEPVALLGTSLLFPHILIVDFNKRRVVIGRSDE